MDEFQRLAEAIQVFLDYQERPRPREAWLAAHPRCRDLLESMLAEHDARLPAAAATPRTDDSGATRGASTPPSRGDTSGSATPIRRSPVTGAIESIGPYRILDSLGEGGMGSVFLAEQTEPIRRRVALKVIRLGLESKDLIARFRVERLSLARMDHPNIAKVLEAGSTADDCPYFVMEYVEGDRITKHCDDRRLSIRERVELLVSVCDGVQHAHQKGIIHRDLKPSNVLVTEVDGLPVPKIIDFGVAKAIDSEELSLNTSLVTQPGRLIGTPLYMSPEQLGATTEGIDTRADVYSLGVLLYEILVGRPPFTIDGKGAGALGEFQLRVREAAPPKPSTQVGRLGEDGSRWAAARRVSPHSWRRRLGGELDWIVLRCLEKDPDRRYPAASELADDLGRYLAHEPVLARAPSGYYLARKLVQRNRGLVTAAALVLIALAAGLGWALVEKSRADRRAWERAEQVYRTNLLLAADALAEGRTHSARQFLDAAPEEFRGWEWRHLESRLDPGARRFDTPVREVRGFSIAADGRTFAVAGEDGTIVQGDIRSGEILATIRAAGPVYGLAANADGSRIVAVGAASSDPDARIWWSSWAMPSGVVDAAGDLDPSRTHRDWSPRWNFQVPAIDADRGRIILVSSDQWVFAPLFVLDLARPEEATAVPSVDGCPLIVGGDGDWIAARSVDSGQPEIVFLDREGTVRIRGAGPREMFEHAISPDRTRLATVTMGGVLEVRSISLDRGSESGFERLYSIDAKQGVLEHVAFTADGSGVVTCGWDRTLSVWDAETGVLRDRSPNQESPIAGLSAVPETQELASVTRDGIVRVWSFGSPDPTALIGHRCFVYPIGIDEELGLVLTAGWDGYVNESGVFRLWDLDSGEPVAAWAGSPGEHSYSARFLPGEAALLTSLVGDTDRSSTLVSRVDLASGAIRPLHRVQGPIVDTAYVPGAGPVWCATWDDQGARLLSLDPESGVVAEHGAWPMYLHERAFWHRIALSPDGSLLAQAATDLTLRIWRTEPFELVRHFPAFERAITSLAFDAAGRRLLGGCEDGIVRVWEVSSGREIARLVGHDLGVLCAQFSPDGRRIATGGRDGTIRIWSGETYEQYSVLTGHEKYVYALAWSSDGERLYSTSGDGTARIWECTPARERVRAGVEREEILARLTPLVAAWLAAPGERSFDDLARDWSDRERQVARQVLLGRTLGTEGP